MRATWLAITRTVPALGNGGGPVSLAIAGNGLSLSASNFGASNAFSSSVSRWSEAELEFILDRASGGCPAGARGIYRWALSDDRSQLTLSKQTDDCASRGGALGRTWARSLVGPSTIGAGVVDSMDPTFAIKLPDDTILG